MSDPIENLYALALFVGAERHLTHEMTFAAINEKLKGRGITARYVVPRGDHFGAVVIARLGKGKEQRLNFPFTPEAFNEAIGV